MEALRQVLDAIIPPQETPGNMSEMEMNQSVDSMLKKVDSLAQKLNELEQLYSNSDRKNLNDPKGCSLVKDKVREKSLGNLSKNRQQDAASGDAAGAHRRQELTCQSGTMHQDERQKVEEAEMQFDVQFAHDADYAKMAVELSIDLDEVDTRIKDLRALIHQKLRKVTTEEKKRLGTAIARLSPEDINKALEMIAQNNSKFQAAGEIVDIDIDAQSDATLWKLMFFVKDRLQSQMKSSMENNAENSQRCSSRRKREALETSSKTALRKSHNLPG